MYDDILGPIKKEKEKDKQKKPWERTTVANFYYRCLSCNRKVLIGFRCQYCNPSKSRTVDGGSPPP
jgi:hypothetical protein